MSIDMPTRIHTQLTSVFTYTEGTGIKGSGQRKI